MGANDIPVNFEYRDKGLAAITARINALSTKIQGKLNGIQKFNASMANLTKSFAPLATYAKSAAVAFGLMAAQIGGLSIGVKNALDVGGRFSDLSTRTGAAVSDLAILEQAFKNNGLAAEAVGPSINKLQKALIGVNDEGEPTNKTFERLGLDMEALKNSSPIAQFNAVGAAINALQDPAERASAAMGIFGKSGGELVTLFADAGAFTQAAKEVGEQAGILERNAALFDKISDQLNLVGLKVQGFFVGMAEQIAPVIEPLMDFFAGTDFASVGQQFGAVIAQAIQAITDGSIWRILLDSALIAIGSAVNFLWKSLVAVISGVGQLLLSAFKVGIEFFGVLGTAEYWKGMGNQLLALVNTFSSAFYGVFAKAVEMLRPILGKVGLGGMVDKASGFLRGAQESTAEAAVRQNAEAAANLGPLESRMRDRMANEANDITGAIASGFKNAPDLPGLSGVQEDLDTRIAGVAAKVSQLQLAALNKGQGAKKTMKLDFAGDDKDSKKKRPTASRLMAISGFGVFVKDPLLAENRRQSQLLERIARNTDPKTKTQPPMMDPVLRFT